MLSFILAVLFWYGIVIAVIVGGFLAILLLWMVAALVMALWASFCERD